MPWIVRTRSRREEPASENSEVADIVYPSDPLEILGTAWALREMVELVTPEEFRWHDAHYDDDSEHGRELLFLIANHEWVRATSEVVDVIRSDVIETTIKTDIDLSQIKHEAFRGKSGRIWLPIAVLPPQIRQRQLEPDLFATVTDAAGDLLPLLPADDLGHQISAALAEIIVNMAVAHSPNWHDMSASGDQVKDQQFRPVATRDERILLSAAIYRLFRREPRKIGIPVDRASASFTIDRAIDIRSKLIGRPQPGSGGPGFSAGSFRLSDARKSLLKLLDQYTLYLAERAIRKRTEAPRPTAESGPEKNSGPAVRPVPRAEFVPELAERAVRVLQALAASTIVVVPVGFDTEPTVLTVRVPTRNLKPTWTKFRWGDVRTWRISPRSWLVRPSGQLAIDILLPTADADRQVQIRLADGVSFDPPAGEPGRPGNSLPRLDIAVKTPPPLLELAASVRPIFEDKVPARPASLIRPLIDLARAKIAAAYHTLGHYQLPPSQAATAAPGQPEPCARDDIGQIQQELVELYNGFAAVTADQTTPADLREQWKHDRLGKLPLYRRTTVDQLDPRTAVARVDMIEDVAQRATPDSAVAYADVHVDDRGYLADARASTLMSLLLMTGVLAFLVLWHFARSTAEPHPEVLAIVLVLFVTVQAGRIERPDRSTLRGQLSGTGSLLIAASVFPAAMLAVALGFDPIWWVAEVWAGACFAAQAGLVALMLWGPLTVIKSPSNQPRGRLGIGQRRKYETEHLYLGHFEALRSDYWRSTTADALTIGRPAFGYLITQNTDDLKDSSGSAPPPELEAFLRQCGASGTGDESSSVLALLHSSTQFRAVTFVVLRGKALADPGDERLRKIHIAVAEDLHLDADRLVPADNVSSMVDLFIGVDRLALRPMGQHPLIKVLQIAKNELITLEAQLPAPIPAGPHLGHQWARVRVALRDTKDIARLAKFLDEVYEELVVPGHAGDLIAVQATPAAQPWVITKSAPGPAPAERSAERPLLWGGDLDVSGIPSVKDELEYAPTWRQIAIYADARSNIESEITQCLPEEYQGYQLAHLNYAVLHGTAEIILLLHTTVTPPRPDGFAEKLDGQPRVVIDKKVSLEQLGPLEHHPMLRVRYRAQDQPGTFVNIVRAIGEFLAGEPIKIAREEWSLSYARVQVVTGQVALGHLTIRLHDISQNRQQWAPERIEQMDRDVSSRAAQLLAEGGKAGPSTNQNPVVSAEFVSKDRPAGPGEPVPPTASAVLWGAHGPGTRRPLRGGP